MTHDWAYLAGRDCNMRTELVDGFFECIPCGIKFKRENYRYTISLTLQDDSGFDGLNYISCGIELRSNFWATVIKRKNGKKPEGDIPEVIGALLERTLLFKVNNKHRLDNIDQQADYNIRKVVTEERIIGMYITQ